jgi:hypothetical protein
MVIMYRFVHIYALVLSFYFALTLYVIHTQFMYYIYEINIYNYNSNSNMNIKMDSQRTRYKDIFDLNEMMTVFKC